MSNRFTFPVITGFVFLLLPLPVALGQITQPDLRAYTEKSIANGDVEFKPPKFKWDDHGVRYHLGEYDLDLPMAKTLMAMPLREQFVVTGIRRHRTQSQQRRFWRPVLEQVEEEIAKMLKIVQNNDMADDVKEQETHAVGERIASIYFNALDKLAQERGGRANRIGVPCAAHVTAVNTIPKTVHLARIGAGEWSFYQYFKDKAPVQEPQWESLPTGQGILLYGKNWIHAKWPDGRSWVKLVDVGISKSITLTPDGVELK